MPPATHRNSLVSPLLVVLILAISAWIQFTVVTHTEMEHPLHSDARDYFLYAYNLKNLGIYSEAWTLADPPQTAAPDSVRPPGYPLFLLLVANPLPDEAFVRRITLVQAGLGVGSVFLVYLMSRKFLPPGWSHGAALLTALCPHLAIFSSVVLSESLFTFLLFASTYSAIIAMKQKRVWLFALTGLLWGLCALVRPTAQFLPPILFSLAILPRYREWLRPAAVMLACFMLVQAPWRLRNLTLPAGHVQPNMTAIFLNFGSYPGFMYENDPNTVGYPYRFDPEAEQSQQDVPHALAHIAQRFREQPLEMISWTLVGKPVSFLSWSNPDGDHDILIFPVTRNPYEDDRRLHAIRSGMFWGHWPLMLLGMVGIVLLAFAPNRLLLDDRQQLAARVVGGVFVYALAFHMIGAPLPRYGIPFRPLLYPMAILVIWTIWTRKSATPPPTDSQAGAN
jgi:4-amino-4-deoxy-L-arabinose transferase-like glycosyltransferase